MMDTQRSPGTLQYQDSDPLSLLTLVTYSDFSFNVHKQFTLLLVLLLNSSNCALETVNKDLYVAVFQTNQLFDVVDGHYNTEISIDFLAQPTHVASRGAFFPHE